MLSHKNKAAAFVIRAFNVEIAQIKDQVHDYKIGEMRLKFWIDALNDTYKGNPPRSPVMLALHTVWFYFFILSNFNINYNFLLKSMIILRKIFTDFTEIFSF